jgi:hypothetical protein
MKQQKGSPSGQVKRDLTRSGEPCDACIALNQCQPCVLLPHGCVVQYEYGVTVMNNFGCSEHNFNAIMLIIRMKSDYWG